MIFASIYNSLSVLTTNKKKLKCKIFVNLIICLKTQMRVYIQNLTFPLPRFYKYYSSAILELLFLDRYALCSWKYKSILSLKNSQLKKCSISSCFLKLIFLADLLSKFTFSGVSVKLILFPKSTAQQWANLGDKRLALFLKSIALVCASAQSLIKILEADTDAEHDSLRRKFKTNSDI